MEENLTNQEEENTKAASPISRTNLERPLRGGWPLANDYLNRHRKLLTYVVGGIMVVILGILAYRYFIIRPQEEEAQSALFKDERYFESDSFGLALKGNGVEPGVQEIADDYGMTKSGNLAKYLTGMSLMHQGKYEDAIDYLKGFKTSSPVIEPLKLGAIGDAYSQLKQYDDAAEYYKKAATADDNKFTAPRFYFKAGLVNEKLGNYKEALDDYQHVKDKYPTSPQGAEIDKYIARAQGAVDGGK